MIKTNAEVEAMDNGENSWLVCWCGYGSTFYLPNTLTVMRNDELMLVDDDVEACKEAEKDGISLIYGMPRVPGGVYVDTEENRALILKSLEENPEFKNYPEYKIA